MTFDPSPKMSHYVYQDSEIAKKKFIYIKKTHAELLGKRRTRKQDLEDAKKQKKEQQERLDSAIKARELMRQVAKSIQSQLELHISNLVTMAQESVFSDPYEFAVRFVERRNKIECDLLFIKEGQDIGDTLFSAGGGPNDVASFALRCSFWSLKRNRSVLMLDEPFRFINDSPTSNDRVLRIKCVEMLEQVCRKLNIQCIIVSTLPEFIGIADRVFLVEKQKGISSVGVYIG